MEKETPRNKKRPPCGTCPYKLGLVHTLRNPCPECRMNNYQAYEWFKKRENI